jgi:nucleotidyltransferase AbiEii toxin of type IV toxin-antitoxin system
MLDLFKEFRALVRCLETAGLDYALCGGLALSVYSAPRATVDIDVMVLPEDMDRLRSLAAELGFDFEAAPMVFADGKVDIRRFSKIEQKSGDVLMLDILVVTPALRDVWASRTQIEWEGGSLRVVSRDGLIDLKRLRGSAVDLEDIAHLEEEG